MMIVTKLPAYVRLSEYLRKKSTFYLYVQSFGITFYIAGTPSVRALFGLDHKGKDLEKPMKFRGISKFSYREDALRDIVNSLELQVRDRVMSGIGAEVKRELFQRFDQLVDAPIQKRIGQLADAAQQRLIENQSSQDSGQ